MSAARELQTRRVRGGHAVGPSTPPDGECAARLSPIVPTFLAAPTDQRPPVQRLAGSSEVAPVVPRVWEWPNPAGTFVDPEVVQAYVEEARCGRERPREGGTPSARAS
jgi:hypothetical protein